MLFILAVIMFQQIAITRMTNVCHNKQEQTHPIIWLTLQCELGLLEEIAHAWF
jgi:hypothetical protein